MDEILESISELDANRIPEVLKAVLERYNEAFPDWEISTVSIQKDGTAYEQIDSMIIMLEKMRDKYKVE